MNRKESYQLVIEAEIMSQLLYEALAKSFRNSEAYPMLLGLVTLEKAHENKVRSAFAKEFPTTKLELRVSSKLDMPGVDLSDPKAVLDFAISREDLAHESYLNLASHTEDENIKNMLLLFAEEESEHKALLLLELQRIHGALQWYDPSELSGLMED